MNLIFDKNGIEFDATPYVQGLDNFIFLRELKEDNSVAFSTSNELIFCTKAYDYLKENGFWDCDNLNCEATCEGFLIIDSCGLEIPFLLRSKETFYCPSKCEIEGSIQLRTLDNEKQECLQNPFVDYLFDGTSFINSFQPVVFNTFDPIFDDTTTIPVRGTRLVDALDIITEQCGLTGWCSNILTQSPWDNLVIVHTDTFNTHMDISSIPFQDGIQPKITVESLLSTLLSLGGECGPFYQYEVRVFNCKLYFEHESFYKDLGEAFTKEEFDNEVGICFKFEEKDTDCTSIQLDYEKAKIQDEGEGSVDNLSVYNSTLISLLPNGTIGDNLCECVFPFSNAAFTENGNLIWRGNTLKPTLVIFDGNYNDAKAIYDLDCGYNYPLHLNESASCPEITQTFFGAETQNKCKIQVSESIELCPKDMCDFIDKLFANDTFKIETECGIVIPNNVEINISTGLVTTDDFEGDN